VEKRLKEEAAKQETGVAVDDSAGTDENAAANQTGETTPSALVDEPKQPAAASAADGAVDGNDSGSN
jgi:hypothetical protein